MYKHHNLCLASAKLLSVLCGLTFLTTTSDLPAQNANSEEGRNPEKSKAPPITHAILEGFPKPLQDRISQVGNQAEGALRDAGAQRPQFLLRISKKWQPGQTLKVAFRGGTRQLHKNIADVAVEWSRFGNIRLDFGHNPATGDYRIWNVSDATFSGDIRICFDKSGYYSLLGTDSINASLIGPGEESMNLQGFDVALPSNWQAVVLHEFGHALGIEHEHQHPDGGCDFRFEDDRGYQSTRNGRGEFVEDSQGRRPGLFTVLGGPPNRWDRSTVEFNLRQLTDSSRAFVTTGELDKLSIMKYFFDAWMFVGGTNSRCFTSSENTVLSAKDTQGIASAYPFSFAGMRAVIEERRGALEVIQKAIQPNTSLRKHLESLRDKANE